MEQKNYIINLLNIQDKHLVLIKIEFKNNTYYIYLSESKIDLTSCPKCGGVSSRINSYYNRTIKINPINGYPAFIILRQIRYICNYCNKTFNQSNEIVDPGCSISIKIKETILEESKYKQSFKDVSNRTNVSQTTISNEFKKHS